jgi:hypothetical protein
VQAVEALNTAADVLKGATPGVVASLELIDRGIWALKIVLSKIPSEVDTDMYDRVQEMDLGELFRALLRVQDRMQGLNVPADEARRFAAGGRDLGRLDREFHDLIDEHNRWQGIDNEMRRIENDWRGNPLELDFAWPRLYRLFSGRLDAVPESWRSELQKEIDQVVKRLSEKADLEAKLDAFRGLRDAAVQWFYELDQTLMRRCEELKVFNETLGLVLKIAMGAKP